MPFRASYICGLSVISTIVCFLLGSAIFSFMILWLLLSLTVFFISSSMLWKNAFVKYVCIGLFSLTLPLSILEGYSLLTFKNAWQDEIKVLDTPVPPELMQDLNPQETFLREHVQRFSTQSGKLLFDIIRTHDSHVRRITPHAPNAKTAVVLLGCSFTFSAGLEDDEAFAFKLGKILGEDYQVFNFGKSGSGPHRLLESLEKGLPQLEGYSKVHFYYFAIEDHLRRIMGAASWDRTGPLYDVEQGKAIKKGILAELRPSYEHMPFFMWVKRSYLFKTIQPHLDVYLEQFLPRYTLEKRLELQKALMMTMNQTIHEKYAHSSFTVLLWPPNTTGLMQPIMGNLPWVDMEQWLPNFEQNKEKYVIAYPEERHPSAYANDIIARKMAELVKKEN